MSNKRKNNYGTDYKFNTNNKMIGAEEAWRHGPGLT